MPPTPLGGRPPLRPPGPRGSGDCDSRARLSGHSVLNRQTAFFEPQHFYARASPLTLKQHSRDRPTLHDI